MLVVAGCYDTLAEQDLNHGSGPWVPTRTTCFQFQLNQTTFHISFANLAKRSSLNFQSIVVKSEATPPPVNQVDLFPCSA